MSTNRFRRKARSGRTPEVSSTLQAREHHRQAPHRPLSHDRDAYTRTRNAEQFRALESRSLRRRDARRRHREEVEAAERQGRQRFLLSAVFALLIFFVGILPLLTTFRQYVASQSQVSDLQEQAQELRRQKSNLDAQIGRWNDKAYVIAQARTRLGFVYPGETSVRVIGADKYAETREQKDARSSADAVGQRNRPWDDVLRTSILQADNGTLPRRSTARENRRTPAPLDQRDPAIPYTPVNPVQPNPYSMTEQQREQALQEENSNGTSQGDTGGIFGRQ